jgi:hypothetical protein
MSELRWVAPDVRSAISHVRALRIEKMNPIDLLVNQVTRTIGIR